MSNEPYFDFSGSSSLKIVRITVPNMGDVRIAGGQPGIADAGPPGLGPILVDLGEGAERLYLGAVAAGVAGPVCGRGEFSGYGDPDRNQ